IQGRLNRGETPWGEAFEPLSDAYIEAMPRREGGIPLNDTHQHIMNRINSQAGGDYVSVGLLDHPETPGLAMAHQFGIGVPARPFMPIYNGQVDLPQAWTAEVLAIIGRHLDLMR
ncbi:MAG: hypothetical protein Q8N96_14650, partial [Methylovulum sp.]|nr:hypothetical protein [Methylovulum sp.]